MYSIFLLVISFQTVSSYGIKPAEYYTNPLAIGPCVDDKCPFSFQCENTRCMPVFEKMVIVGPCVNNLCPKNYSCHMDVCVLPVAESPVTGVAIGPCINNMCPNSHLCYNNECFPADSIKTI